MHFHRFHNRTNVFLLAFTAGAYISVSWREQKELVVDETGAGQTLWYIELHKESARASMSWKGARWLCASQIEKQLMWSKETGSWAAERQKWHHVSFSCKYARRIKRSTGCFFQKTTSAGERGTLEDMGMADKACCEREIKCYIPPNRRLEKVQEPQHTQEAPPAFFLSHPDSRPQITEPPSWPTVDAVWKLGET